MAGIFTQGPINESLKFIEDIPASMGSVAGASRDKAFETNPTLMLMEGVNSYNAKGKILNEEEINSLATETGVKVKVPKGGMTEGAAMFAIDRKYREKLQDSIIARSEGGILNGTVSFGAGLWASLYDPINLGSAFLPFARGTKWAATLALSRSTAYQRAAARAQMGVIEGAFGNAAIEPIVYALARDMDKDYTMADSLLNVTFGGILGGGLHVGGGALADAFQRTGSTLTAKPESGTIGARVAGMPAPIVRETASLAIAQAVNGRKIDVESAMPEVWRSNRDPNVIRKNRRGGDPFSGELPGYVRPEFQLIDGREITSPQLKAYYDSWVQMRDDPRFEGNKPDGVKREPTAIELAYIKARIDRYLRESPPTQEDFLRLQHRQAIRARKAKANAEITPAERVDQVEGMWAEHDRQSVEHAAERVLADKQARKEIADIARHIDVSNEMPNMQDLSKFIKEPRATVSQALQDISQLRAVFRSNREQSPLVIRKNRRGQGSEIVSETPSQADYDVAISSADPTNSRMYDAEAVKSVDETIKNAPPDATLEEQKNALTKELHEAIAEADESGADAAKLLQPFDEEIALARKENKALDALLSCQLRKG